MVTRFIMGLFLKPVLTSYVLLWQAGDNVETAGTVSRQEYWPSVYGPHSSGADSPGQRHIVFISLSHRSPDNESCCCGGSSHYTHSVLRH